VASAARLQFLVSGNNQFSRITIACTAAAEALKKAREFIGRGYMDVRICTPRGQILSSDEFDRLE
jgi:3-oxoacyl-(acyl-carrier-protein) synthase